MNTTHNTSPDSTANTGNAINAAIESNFNTRRNRRLLLATAVAAGSIAVGFGGSSASAIVEGEPTTAAANPWQVSLQSGGEHFCGGSLVSPRVVVTAAHCTQGTDAADITVRAGAADLGSTDGQSRQAASVIENQKYVSGVGDIAMIVLDSPFDASPNIETIKTATAAETAAATTARVTGWGVTSETSETSPSVLQTTDVPMVSDADCGLVDDGNDDELCAGGTGTDSCYGDSGGPLTIETDRGRVLAGVVSWGDECGGPSAGVYAEVPTYTEWINERVADPDADAGERLPAPDYGDFGEGDFEDGDFEDGDFEDGDGAIEIDDEFIDQYLEDHPDVDLENMTDEQFEDFITAFEATQGDVSDSDDGDFEDGDSDSNDQAGSPDFENMTDDEFEEYINNLSDEDFDALLDEWDAVEPDDNIDADTGDDDMFADDFADGDFADDFDSEPADDGSTDDFADDYDSNADGVVQWNELEELFG